ncbi:MAG: EamA family transporter RarD [Pseudomonadota bacterium]
MAIDSTPSAEERTGIISALAAYLFWGLLPIYFIVLADVRADELLVHRILWSVPFGALIVTLRGQWPDVLGALKKPKLLLWLTVTSFIIGANWLTYIVAVQKERIFEASLGYYINPLLYVVIGVVFFRERLRPGQWLAVALAALGVSILTVYGGELPLIALFLAVSFAAYGSLRKLVAIGAMPGLFIETIVLAPLAGLWMATLVSEQAHTFGTGLPISLLLLLAGPATVTPLVLFAISARRLPLTVIGFLQFITPTMQFAVGLINGEPFTMAHALCFGFIWSAAILFVWDMLRNARRRGRPQAADGNAENSGAPEGERGERRPA